MIEIFIDTTAMAWGNIFGQISQREKAVFDDFPAIDFYLGLVYLISGLKKDDVIAFAFNLGFV